MDICVGLVGLSCLQNGWYKKKLWLGVQMVDDTVIPGTHSESASKSRTDILSNLDLSSYVNQGMPLPGCIVHQET